MVQGTSCCFSLIRITGSLAAAILMRGQDWWIEKGEVTLMKTNMIRTLSQFHQTCIESVHSGTYFFDFIYTYLPTYRLSLVMYLQFSAGWQPIPTASSGDPPLFKWFFRWMIHDRFIVYLIYMHINFPLSSQHNTKLESEMKYHILQ